ncbi:MAG: 3-hydroxybutyryl-CoA dehydrogenase [Chitinophagaceae bacterium]|nr:MAG: 3-hydroxybutyryl-CoA dehydrogenase [Chitinophagaceae bacterium]
MTINSICICGAGTMGRGIALASARAGFFTLLFDLDSSALDRADEAIKEQLQQSVSRNKLTAEEEFRILEHIHYTSDLQTCLADLFIEAIVEKTEAKISLFNQLAELNHSECIFATNTSSLSVTGIARGIKNPERVIGLHFFNPADRMKLVEVVVTPMTNSLTVESTTRLAEELGKTPVICKDAPGFIVNRVARPYYIEALRLAEKGVPVEQVDRVMEASGFRMGPFRLMDLIGHDVNYAVSVSVYEQLDRPERLRPSVLQQEKVQHNELGRKSGKGFYDYNDSPEKP